MKNSSLDFSDVRVLVVGDIFLDRYVEGTVDRLSPEAPVPVLLSTGARSVLGGAGNVAANVTSFGGRAELIGAIGEDETGDEINDLVSNADIVWNVATFKNRRTAVKTRYLAGHHQMLRVDEESIGDVEGILLRIRRALNHCDVLVLADYCKGVLPDVVCQAAISTARELNVLVIADPCLGHWGRYLGADIVTPNRAELESAWGVRLTCDTDYVHACRSLIASQKLGAIIATRGETGLSVIRKNGASHIRAHFRKVFDVSGAGDTVVAALACGMGAGLDISEAAEIANAAAGIVVGKVGTATVTAEELLDAVDSPIRDLSVLLSRVQRWRNDGLSVGFTNGCFDLLHSGHLSTLEFAKAQCDRLVVAVNSDKSVRALKGSGRPVNRDRAEIVAKINCVDAVVEFDGDVTIIAAAIRPDVMVKGGDYEGREIIGTGHAARVAVAPMIPGRSTTEIVERCSQRI